MKIRFHLPGLRYNFPLNMILVGMMKQYPDFFYDNIEIGSFFGEFPTSRSVSYTHLTLPTKLVV